MKKAVTKGRRVKVSEASTAFGPPTLRQVAQRAGVSVATASNVINKKYQLMGLHSRARVENAIRELNYRVNATGRNLRASSNMAVAFISLDDSESFLRDPFTSEILSGLANSLTERGFKLTVERISPDGLEESPLFSTNDAAGLCLDLQGSQEQRRKALNRISTLRLPMVLIENEPVSDMLDLCHVRQDDFGGAQMLARHLKQTGVRSILFVRQGVNWASIEERDSGISAVFETGSSKLRMQRLLVDHLRLAAEIEERLPDHFDEIGIPDAIMGSNDQIAAACMKVLAQHGLGVPEDVAVTGFNGFELFDLLPYRITTIRSSAYELGFRGGRELAHRLQSGTFQNKEVVLSVTMRIGETTRGDVTRTRARGADARL